MSTTTPTIHAEVRDRLGKRYATRTRAEGKLPAVIYGHKQDPVHIAVDNKEMVTILHHNAHLIEVEVAGKTEPCLVKDIQWDHLGDSILHLDLARVDLTEEVEVEVEIELVGEAVGLKDAGTIMDQAATMIEVKCRANAIPEKLTLDVSEMGVGDSRLVSDLILPAGVTAVSEPDTLIAHVTVTKAAPAEEEEAVEEGAEPEVIGEKAEDEAKGE